MDRYHNSKMINHDLGRGLSIFSMQQSGPGSVLVLPRVGPGDSGNYTCSPQHLRPASAVVHILDDDASNSAAHPEAASGTRLRIAA